MVLLSKLLMGKEFSVVKYSDKENKLFRLLEMCFGVIKHHKAEYLLIDTYSTSNFYYAFIISQLARVLSIKYIPILHGGNLPERLKKSPLLSQMIFKYSKINISPSAYLKESFEKEGFQTKVIPNSLAIEAYPFIERRDVQPKLLWVRAFDKIYNPILAITIVKKLKEQYPKVKLCMVGADKDGSLKDVKKRVVEYQLENSVEFTGRLSKKEWIEKSKAYDFFINTTNFDNTPVSVIEAMALGLPVISTNVGGLAYLIKNNKTGILVAPNDSEAFVKQIVDLISNPEKAVDLSKNARIAIEKFDSRRVAEQWEKVLN